MTSPLIARNVSSTPALVGGEADRSGGVERLRLDGVAQLDTSATTVGERGAERIGERTERQRHRGDAGAVRASGPGG